MLLTKKAEQNRLRDCNNLSPLFGSVASGGLKAGVLNRKEF